MMNLSVSAKGRRSIDIKCQKLIYLLSLTFILIVPLYFYSRPHFSQSSTIIQSKYTYPSAIPIPSFLLTPSNIHNIFSDSSTNLFKQTQQPPSYGEIVLTYHPFCIAPESTQQSLSPIVAHTASNRSFTCSDFSHNVTLSKDDCSAFSFHRKLKAFAPFSPATIRNSTLPLMDAVTLPFSAIVINMHHRDNNVCHLLMRLTFAWNVIRRASQGVYGTKLDTIKHIILVSKDRRVYTKLSTLSRFSNDYFHSGALRTFFNSTGVQVIVARSIDELVRNNPGGVCYKSVAVIGSHSNRFAFPDSYLTKEIRESGLPYPLSSDALAMRAAVFKPREPPKRRRKIIYIARAVGKRRSFDHESEYSFRQMLRRVARDANMKLEIFDAGKWIPSFWGQVSYVQDASIIVGIHGAGLSLGIFAPNEGVSMVEIQPSDQKIQLFHNLALHGIHHTIVRLQEGSRIEKTSMSVIFDEDMERIRNALVDRVKRTSI